MNSISNIFRGTTPVYYILGSTIIILIALYGKYRCDHIKNHTDILEGSLFSGSSKYGLDGWSGTHYLFFLILGYYFPETLMISMVYGLSWELFETYVGIYKPKFIQGLGFCKSVSSNNKHKVWWYGKWSDLIVNFFGFMSGRYLTGY